MQLRKNYVISYIRLRGGEVARHGNMYLANHEKYDTTTEIVSRGHTVQILLLITLFDGLGNLLLG